MEKDLVSVICICHNQGKYIKTAIDSIFNQTYHPIELIIVDDKSEDNSREVIAELIKHKSDVHFIQLDTRVGNCRAFNRGLARSNGNYIIDLAADDVLLPERIQEGVHCFSKCDYNYGINFTDALYIDENDKIIKQHYRRNRVGSLKSKIPEGYIYTELLSRYFICTPTMMIKRKVFDRIGGYDENLVYEDFDFWIRTGKLFKYCYTDKILVKKRILRNSLSTHQYIKNSQFLKSTYRVCQKAEEINETEEDRKALLRRVSYEFRKALFSRNFEIAAKFAGLIQRNSHHMGQRNLFAFLNTILK